jgi:hypothetical protein
MMAKKPADRPASMREVVAAIDDCLGSRRGTLDAMLADRSDTFTDFTDRKPKSTAVRPTAASASQAVGRFGGFLRWGGIALALLLVTAGLASLAFESPLAWFRGSPPIAEPIPPAPANPSSDLLRSDPREILWPAAAASRWEFRQGQAGRELSISCSHIGLLQLGEAVGERDYELQVEFSQTPWTGSVGVFFGHHAVEEGGILYQRCQALFVDQQPVNDESRYVLQRVLLVRRADSTNMKRTDYLATYPLPLLLAGSKHSLTAQVAQEELVQVLWDGKPLTSEGPAAVDPLSAADSRGELGIYVSGAGCLVHRANMHIDAIGEAP